MKSLPILLMLAPACFAQEEPTIKVDVNLVNVLCSVRNKSNGLVGNLEKGDFQIFEENKPQQMTFFTRERNQPVVIGFILDMSTASHIHWKNYQTGHV